ncbi:MAG: sporulation protein YunB [Clostridia bacterium]|nr:sporulation protein YunB [Clostridia bacterium]
MIRNYLTYQRFKYGKHYKGKSHILLKIIILLISLFIILALLVTYSQNKMWPYLEEFSEFKAKENINRAVTNAISKELDSNVSYEQLVTISRDKDDRITSIQTNIVEMNRLSTKIAAGIQRELSFMKYDVIDIPLGTLMGDTVFTGIGPDIHIKIQPYGDVETDFNSEFSSAGINQTRHRIYLQIKTRVGIVVPLMKKKTEVITSVPVVETIIVGDTPEFYVGDQK